MNKLKICPPLMENTPQLDGRLDRVMTESLTSLGVQSLNFSTITSRSMPWSELKGLCAKHWLKLAFIIPFTVSDTGTTRNSF